MKQPIIKITPSFDIIVFRSHSHVNNSLCNDKQSLLDLFWLISPVPFGLPCWIILGGKTAAT